jgi:O-antigen/teichoic acid export membrane protein
MSSYRIATKMAYLLSAQWIRELLQMAFLILLARSGTTTFGQFMLAVSIGQILLFSTEFGINQHLTVSLSKRREHPKALIGQSLLVKTMLFGASWLVMVAFCLTQGYDQDLLILILVISTSIGLDAFSSSLYAAYRVLGRQDAEAKIRTGGAVLGYGFGLTSLLAGAPMLVIALFKPLDTAFAAWATLRDFLKKKPRFRIRGWTTLWVNWRGSVVFMGMSISAILYNRINIFFIQNHSGPDLVAKYSATWQVVDFTSITVSSMLLGKILFPIFTRLWASSPGEFSRLAKASAMLLLAAALPAMFVVGMENELIISTIFGAQYRESAMIQPLLGWCILFAFMHNLCAYLMTSMEKQHLLFAFYLVGLAVNLALCATLIPQSPLWGAAWSIVITKGVVALLSVGYCQIRLRLIGLKTFATICTALGVAFALYWVGQLTGMHHLAVGLGLIPLVSLCLFLWHNRPRKQLAPVRLTAEPKSLDQDGSAS